MSQPEDKIKLLLYKVAKLDNEFKDMLRQTNLDTYTFKKIDNALYVSNSIISTNLQIWYGFDDIVEKNIIFYVDNKPINIYIAIEPNTKEIKEIEFFDWENVICDKVDCLDFALQQDIKIIKLKRPKINKE